jgi:hypothetical protein
LKLDGEQEVADSSEEEESIPSIARAKGKKKQKNQANAFQMLEQGDEAEDAVPESPSDQENGLSTPQSTNQRGKRREKQSTRPKIRSLSPTKRPRQSKSRTGRMRSMRLTVHFKSLT